MESKEKDLEEEIEKTRDKMKNINGNSRVYDCLDLILIKLEAELKGLEEGYALAKAEMLEQDYNDDKPIYLKTSAPLMELERDKGRAEVLAEVEKIIIELAKLLEKEDDNEKHCYMDGFCLEHMKVDKCMDTLGISWAECTDIPSAIKVLMFLKQKIQALSEKGKSEGKSK